jgi:hypothetical protein
MGSMLLMFSMAVQGTTSSQAGMAKTFIISGPDTDMM